MLLKKTIKVPADFIQAIKTNVRAGRGTQSHKIVGRFL